MNIGRKPQKRPFGTPILQIARGSVGDGGGVAEAPPEGDGIIGEIKFGIEGCGMNGDGAGRMDGPGATPPFAAVIHSNGTDLQVFADESWNFAAGRAQICLGKSHV